VNALTKAVSQALVEVEPEHSPWGPSASAGWLHCHAYVSMNIDAPDRETPEAALGTAAHLLGSTTLLAPGTHPRDYLGQRLYGHEVDQDMVQAVSQYVNVVRRQARQKGAELLVETRVRYEEYVPGGYGTSDGIVLQNRAAHIHEYKHGEGVEVFAERNTQGGLYGLGVYHDLGFLHDLETFHIYIHQPRIKTEPSVWTVGLEELLAFGEQAREAATLGREAMVFKERGEPIPERYFHPSDKTCQWCAVKAVCKARIEDTNQAIGVQFDYDDDMSARFPDPNTLTLEQLSQVLPRLDAFSNWVKAVKDYAVLQHETGHQIPNHKMVAGGRRSRHWRDPAVVEAQVKAWKIALARYCSVKLNSPHQMEQILGPKRWAVLEEQVVWSDGKATLVHESDPRPAIGLSEDDFDYDDDEGGTIATADDFLD